MGNLTIHRSNTKDMQSISERFPAAWFAAALKAVLFVTLASFVVGHWWAHGAVWNYQTKDLFDPLDNYVSDYAYRSPCWFLFVGCMYSFALIMSSFAFLLYFRAKRSWRVLVAVICLGYAALSMIEVAVFPVKPPEVSVEEIQNRMDAGHWQRFKADIKGWFAEYPDLTADQMVAMLSGNQAHVTAITRSMSALFLAMLASLLLPMSSGRWNLGLCLLTALIAQSISMMAHYQRMPGLWQRIEFLAVFAWMFLMIRLLLQLENTRQDEHET